MAQLSRIEWTDATWNPVTGCTKISPGCKFCYAERMARRLHAMGQPRYRNNFRSTLQPDLLDIPLRWSKPRAVFVNSMSDLFHEAVPDDYIHAVFETIERADWHVFQVLTKRSDRLRAMAAALPWPENLWTGVSIETEKYLCRVRDLQRVPAAVRFLSVEPLLGPIPRLPLAGIHWVIVGGESGPGARPLKPEWVRAIRDRCLEREVPFFFKQWGGVRKKKKGRVLDGQTWDTPPAIR
jgi:protein gp37